MFCGLGEEERTKFRKKKKEKKKNLTAAKSGLVGMKGYFKTYKQMKYFLPYFSRFQLRPLFTPNLRGGLIFQTINDIFVNLSAMETKIVGILQYIGL